MRIAYFSPLNPLPTGISDYSEELLPSLAEHAEIDVYTGGFTPSNPMIRECFRICDIDEFPERHTQSPYDVNLYQMGNSIHHAEIFRTLMRYPGVVVLHDTILHHFFLELANRENDPIYYLREMLYERGSEGMALGADVLRGVAPAPFYEYPLLGRVSRVSLGIIVHSRYAADQVKAYRREKIAVVSPHIAPPTAVPAAQLAALRAQLGVGDGQVLFGSFGTASPPKRLEVALRAFARLRGVVPSAHFVIVGPVSPPGWLDPIVDDLRLRTAVTITGAVPFDDFIAYLWAADVCLNLRYPTAGESSASLLRVMAAGRPVLVSDVGSFREFPDPCVVKVPVDSREEDCLYGEMQRLATDSEYRRHLGQRALDYVLSQHGPEVTARGYVEAIEQILTRVTAETVVTIPAPGVDGAPSQLAPSPSQMNVSGDLQRELATALDELGLS